MIKLRLPLLWVLALLIFISVSVGLSGCAQKQQNDHGVKELEFWTLQLLDFKDLFEPMIADYEKAHPDIKIKWVDVPFSEGEKRALTALMSPNVPDIINLNPDFSAILASRKALIDIRSHISEEEYNAYLPVSWQAASMKLSNGNDITYGVPWYITSSVTLYNKSILKEAGLSNVPENFMQLRRFSGDLKLASPEHYALMPAITQRGGFLKELKKAGIPLFDKDGKSVVGGSLAVSHLSMYKSMYESAAIPAEFLTEGHRAAVDRYQAGTLALLMTGPNFLNIVQENAPNVFDQTEVAPQFPENSEYKEFSEMLLVVPVKSKYPDEAVDFALYMTNAVNQLALCKRAPVLPSATKAVEDDYFKSTPKSPLIDRARSISAAQLKASTEAYQVHPRQSDINQIIDHYVQTALLGKMTPKEALLEAQEKINQLL